MRQVLEMALEAVKTAQNNLAPSRASAARHDEDALWDEYDATITAIKEALAQPEQEPVAWRWIPSEAWNEYVLSQSSERAKLADEHGLNPEPLYTHPQPKEPEQEPACWVYPEFWEYLKTVNCATAYGHDGNGPYPDGIKRQPLYTTPPQRKPLTDEQIQKCYETTGHHQTLRPQDKFAVFALARAIEAAHGIK